MSSGGAAALALPVDEWRIQRLSSILSGYVSFVLVAALVLPILSLLQYQHKIHMSWLIDNGRSMLPWSATLAILAFLFRKSLHKGSLKIASWLLETPAAKPRWIVLILCLTLFTSYSWQLNIGIAHRGVPGWAYVDIPEFIQTDAPANLSMPADVNPSVFASALQSWVMPFIHKTGYASSEVMFLHFKDGSMRPANYQLAMVSWPKATFKLQNGKLSHGAAFLAIVRHYFAKRRAGFPFILPDCISYPNHINYQRIDYSSYPPASDIVGASLWTVTARVDAEKKTVKIAGARKLTEVIE